MIRGLNVCTWYAEAVVQLRDMGSIWEMRLACRRFESKGLGVEFRVWCVNVDVYVWSENLG